MDVIAYSWFNAEKTVLLCTYNTDNWTWDDFHKAFQTQIAMIETVSHPKVHIIVDTTASHWLPKGGTLLSGLGKLTNLKHPRQGHTFIVGAKGIIASFARIVTKMMGDQQRELHLTDTIEEAEKIVLQLLAQTTD